MKGLLHSDGITVYAVLVAFHTIISFAEGSFNRCFKCRSRGDLGSCKDKFVYDNVTALEAVTGVEAIPCTSGWCGKIMDKGSNTFKDEEYGAATERVCLLKGPDDSEERCAPTTWRHQKVFMCFCQGDLCNKSYINRFSLLLLILPLFCAFA